MACNIEFIELCWFKLIEAEWRIYASMNLVIVGFDNGSSPNRRQAIFETNDDLSLNEHRGTKFSEIWIKFFNIFIEENAFENVVCEKLAILSWPDVI